MRRVLLANLYCLWPRLKGDNFSLPSKYTLNFFWLFILARHDKLSRKPAEQCTPIWGGIVWETFIRRKKQMDKTLAFNEITPLPYCFKVLQTCFGLPEFDTEKGQSSSFVPEPPANFRTTGYIGLSVLTFFFRLIIVGSNLFCLIMHDWDTFVEITLQSCP